MKSCVFCKIMNQEADAHIVYESKNIMAFLDIDPINEGHVLIIPKTHTSTIDKVPLMMLEEMMALSQKIVSALREIYQFDGYGIMQNGGHFCQFGHFHLHIYPRYQGDGFDCKFPEGPFEFSSSVSQRIVKHIK